MNCMIIDGFLGKRIRRQVQYFQPGQDEVVPTAFDDDQEYQAEEGQHAGSDNEYKGAIHVFMIIAYGAVIKYSYILSFLSDRLRFYKRKLIKIDVLTIIFIGFAKYVK